jgi:hypothetical protein
MSDPILRAHEMHQTLRQKCDEMIVRTAYLIDQADQNVRPQVVVSMIEQSTAAVAFWTGEIVKAVK